MGVETMGVETMGVDASRAGAPAGTRSTAGRGAAPRRGLSLVEASVAAAILLLLAVGVLPLFAQALATNLAGADSSFASDAARSTSERLYQLPFDHPELTLVAGTERVTESYYSLTERRWKPGSEPAGGPDPALWRRTTTIRHYGVGALEDELLETTEALDAAADPGHVHLKEIEVSVRGTRTAGPLGPGRGVAVRLLKSH